MMGYLAAFLLGLYIMPWFHVTAAVVDRWGSFGDDGLGGRLPWSHPILNVALTYALAPYVAFREMSGR